jgi:hypothetical protein
MADNWWGGTTNNGTPTFNAGDLLANIFTGGAWGAAKTYGQTGDLGQAAMYGLGGNIAVGLNLATGGFGEQNADTVANAAAAEQAKLDEANKRAVLEQAKANKANAPYAQAGRDALAQQRALAGLDGPEAQQAALSQLENSPQFQSMVQQSEQGILANASATGGLRGGNTQQALAQNRPQLLSQLIDQQYGRLGGLAGAGQQGSQFTSGLGAQYANMAGNNFAAQGQSQSGSLLAQQSFRNAGRDQAINYGIEGAGLVGKTLLGAF